MMPQDHFTEEEFNVTPIIMSPSSLKIIKQMYVFAIVLGFYRAGQSLNASPTLKELVTPVFIAMIVIYRIVKKHIYNTSTSDNKWYFDKILYLCIRYSSTLGILSCISYLILSWIIAINIQWLDVRIVFISCFNLMWQVMLFGFVTGLVSGYTLRDR